MKYLIITTTIILLCISMSGQTVVLGVDQETQNRRLERGPNLKRFTHFYISAGFVSSADKPGARIIYGSSINLAIGVRKKYKITNVYSAGFEFDLQYTDYKFKQEEGKVFPDTTINNISSRLDYNSISAGVYNRINFDPGRGNYLGNFLDLGIKGYWYYSITSIAKNDLPDGTLSKNLLKDLPYVNHFGASVYSRIGMSHFAIFGSYRITELFKATSGYPDLPRLIVGIDLGVF